MKVSLKLSNSKPIVKDFTKSCITIGRSTKADFVIIDEALSRLHAQVDDENGEFYITDLGSSNGVMIDGVRIAPHQKTKVNSFQQISIGAYDCELEYTEAESTPSPVTSRPNLRLSETDREKSELPTFQNRQINSRALKGPAIVDPKVKAKKSGLKFNFGLAALLGLIVFGIYFSGQETSEERSELDSLPAGDALLQNVPESQRNIPDDFKNDYTQYHGGANCTYQLACSSMKLSATEGEGAFLDGNELFIYVYPEAHTDPLLEKLKEKSFAADATTLYLLLSSEVMNDLSAKKFGQIHLIIIDRMVKPLKVFRLHTKYFSSSEHLRLLSQMAPAFDTGDMTPFWKEASLLIKTKEL